ncbi:hypothetical protein MPTK1_2g08850 [Marchantia polymorpha subsp. ruderalis]|uniref:Kazal-like domain-containing protein n=2 Tax=Marchantia polymorpha TaxID=3197 RepID=A0A176WLL9_MARPO|nr:hypothetical protein AXG93_4773s1090 [Marchantia polymorpha subsp. ruderalis]PTQ45384.1 hypothetical protein MARPO_0015s0170 [Marchantia polymorpha]BBN01617.1 hypothetical protein Mp_2g08850 [Marchantia polymorpha subsp. ruderalis]|eukprot:PTQ45384.1 hypothetical protein MARPO_0015s0170 [Marchantia polymorpha]
MADPCCKWLSVLVFVCLLFTRVTSATHLDSSEESVHLWELPVSETKCDSVTPVCGENGVRFESSCHAIAAGVRIVEDGACLQAKKPACNVKCFRADPVCGDDGITYWCGVAEAKCANVQVAHTGFCDLKSGGPGENGNRAAQSLFLVNLVWLALAGFLVIAGFP